MGFINIFFGLLRTTTTTTTSPALERPRVPGNQKQIMSATICSAKGDSDGKTESKRGTEAKRSGQDMLMDAQVIVTCNKLQAMRGGIELS